MALVTAEVATDRVDWARRVINGAELFNVGNVEPARIALGYAERCIERSEWSAAYEFASDALNALHKYTEGK